MGGFTVAVPILQLLKPSTNSKAPLQPVELLLSASNLPYRPEDGSDEPVPLDVPSLGLRGVGRVVLDLFVGQLPFSLGKLLEIFQPLGQNPDFAGQLKHHRNQAIESDVVEESRATRFIIDPGRRLIWHGNFIAGRHDYFQAPKPNQRTPAARRPVLSLSTDIIVASIAVLTESSP